MYFPALYCTVGGAYLYGAVLSYLGEDGGAGDRVACHAGHAPLPGTLLFVRK